MDIAAGVDAGTTGVGAHLSIPVAQNFNARFGFGILNYSFNENTDNVAYDLKLKLKTVDALIDWHPMGSGFRVTGGLAYNGNKIEGTGRPAVGGSYNFNGNSFPASTAGQVDANIDFRKVAPYIGIGWGNALARQSGGWSFQADLGVLFQGSARTSLVNTNCTAGAAVCNQIATELAAESAALTEDIRQLRHYPVVRIGVAYKF